jgi:hypothetical protein
VLDGDECGRTRESLCKKNTTNWTNEDTFQLVGEREQVYLRFGVGVVARETDALSLSLALVRETRVKMKSEGG